MEQLSIFDTLKKPTKKKVIPEPNTTPITEGGYQIILGLRYSLTEVEGWVAVYDLQLYRPTFPPPQHYSVLPRDQTVWVDPKTIASIHNNNSGMAWGFGPRHEIGRHNYECISFDFQNADDYNWVKDKVY